MSRTETITKTYYQFHELSKEAKDKALEEYRDINHHENWYEPILEGLTEELENEGFQEIDISFTGFWCQGDGASFTCESMNLLQVMKTLKIKNKYRSITKMLRDDKWAGCFIKRDKYHNYVHENTTTVYLEGDTDWSQKALKNLHKVRDEIQEYVRKRNKELYNRLEKHYYKIAKDEAIQLAIEANGYEFNKDGTKV